MLRETIDAVYKSNPKAAAKVKPGAPPPRPVKLATSGAAGPCPVRVTMGAGGGNGAPTGHLASRSRDRARETLDIMEKSLDRKLAAIHADPGCREFIIADAKDADMALGIGAPGSRPRCTPARCGSRRSRNIASRCG